MRTIICELSRLCRRLDDHRSGFLVLALSSVLSTPAFGQLSVLTAQYDNFGTGTNSNETVLNTSNVNVNLFGKLFSRPVDGYLYGQPLYVSSVPIPGQGTHNVVYVATTHNTVYAFDADLPSQSTPYWQVSLGPARPSPGTFLPPELGVLSTPVIDPSSSTLYVVAATLESGSYLYRLHALDITTGQEKFAGPVVIQAKVSGTGYDNQGGVVTLNPQNVLQRPALSLINGVVYIAFGSIEDTDPYHGWVLGYNASNVQQQVMVYNDTPNGGKGGIWQSGRGLLTDGSSSVYLMTGNGDFNGVSNFGDTILKLNSSGGILDWFTPDNQGSLASEDLDLGSGGASLLIPNTNMLVGGGKQGMLYLVNSGNMGHIQTGNGQILQSFQAATGEIHSTAYWSPFLFLWGSNDVVKAYQLVNGTFNTSPSSQNGLRAPFPGGGLAVSANGSTSGTGILWAITPGGDSSASTVHGTLRAYDATYLANELWDSDQAPSRDSLGYFAKFASPTIANGKAYVPTFSDQLAVYGLLPLNAGIVPASIYLQANGQQQFTAIISGTQNTAVTWSMNPSVGTLSSSGLYTAPAAVSTMQEVNVTVTLVADPSISATATVTLLPPGTFGPFRVDAGGPAYTDNLEQLWNADTGFTGGAVSSTTALITNTPDPILYQTVRYGSSFSYQFPVPAGNYTITLKFAEIYFTSAGQRVFNVAINGTTVLPSFDIVAQAGAAFKALDKSFTVSAPAGQITIQFSAGSANLPLISAIQILPASGVGVQVSPPAVNLSAAQSQQFTATVTGTSTTGVTWSMTPNVGTLSSAGLYTAPASIASQQVVTVTATSVADPTVSAAAAVTLLSPGVRVNSGGPAYTDTSGHVWSADTGFTGGAVSGTTTLITNTSDPALYQNVRYGSSFSYQFAVPAGTYTVTLKFAETYFTSAGKRIFDVAINGTTVLSSFDIVAQAGAGFKALDEPFTVSAPAGQITIQFSSGSANLPLINAIQILPASGVGVQVTPTAVNLSAAQSQQFTATVTGTSTAGVTWSMTPSVGTLSSTGLYTAPASITSSQAVTVTATSVADTTQSANATVTLLSPVSVSVSPPSVSLSNGQTQQFNATVTGATNTTVTWSMTPSVGTLSSTGLYTAPASVTSQQVVTITATSVADTTQSANATVTLQPPISVSVSPASVSLLSGQTQQFNATVTGTTNTTVTWSMTPSVGTLSTTGLYTAPASIVSQQVVTITANSVANPSFAATATVTLTLPAGTFVPIRIDAGGPAYTDSSGQLWSADTGFTGGAVSSTATLITNTSDPALYQTVRYGSSFSYQFAVPVGTYSVTLKFAETYFTSAGQRIFNVAINGTTVLASFDVVAQAGAAFKALDKAFTVSAPAGQIAIQFTSGSANLPLINAIQILLDSGVAVQLNPLAVNLLIGQSQQFTATVTGTGTTGVTWSMTPSVGTLSGTGLYSAPANLTSQQVVTVTATSVADPSVSAAATLTVMPIRVNSGGAVYTDSSGQLWSADTGFTGGAVSGTATLITNTTDPALYQKVRYGSSFSYQFAVPAGTYTVTLKFAETYFTSVGKRIFNVAINGTTVLSSFDIVAQAGAAFKALDEPFTVSAPAGQITVQFSSGPADLPLINAIQIQ